MKFCSSCGAEIHENAVICVKCGCRSRTTKGINGYIVGSKVTLILACILNGIALIPLAWCVPMTISIFSKLDRGEKIGVGLIICTALFVSPLSAGLLMCVPQK